MKQGIDHHTKENIDAEIQISTALNVLANWVFKDLETRQVITQVIRKLEQGSEVEQRAAVELKTLSTYLGSIEAQKIAFTLHSLVSNNRAAVGIKTKGRGKSYHVKGIKHDDEIMVTAILYEQGLATKKQLRDAAYRHNGLQANIKSIDSFLSELEPIAKEKAKFLDAFNRGLERKTSL
jgi:hypothetical protein